TITLPENAVTLDGTASAGRGGASIISYDWTEISGPSIPFFGSQYAAKTTVSGLVAGIYVFTLLVTDNNGSVAEDQVAVTVKAPGNFEASYQQIRLPANALFLKDSGDTLISRFHIYPNPVQDEHRYSRE
ncbi:MAG: PKD domain-containing protein, partial [Chitinophagaceae bacterium]